MKQVTEGMLLKAGEDGNRSELMSKIWEAPYPPEAVNSRTSGKYNACMKIIHLTMDADDRQFIKDLSIALLNQGNHDANQLVKFHARIKKIVADSFEKMDSFDHKSGLVHPDISILRKEKQLIQTQLKQIINLP